MKKDNDQFASHGIVEPGPTPFEQELSVHLRITALDGANIKGMTVRPEDLQTFEGQRFLWSEIKEQILSGFKTDKRLRAERAASMQERVRDEIREAKKKKGNK